MTSNVKVEAHCGSDRRVAVSGTDDRGMLTLRHLKDGETHEQVFYDDMAVTVREVSVGDYRHKPIELATAAELLHALLHMNGMSPGPRKTEWAVPHSEALIAIGPDATASISICDEDIETLNQLVCG